MYRKLREFLFVNTTVKQTVAKNTFWLFVSESLGRVLKMALVVYAARILGADGWGIFSYALSVGSLIIMFSDIGLSTLVSREAVQKKEGYKQFITAACLIKSVVLAISILLVIIIGPTISNIPAAAALFPLIGAIYLFDSIREFGFSINRASEKMEREMTVKTIMNIFVLVIGFVLVIINPVPMSVAIAYAIGSFVGCAAILFIIRKDMLEFFAKTDWRTVKMVFGITWPLALVTLIGTIMANTDIYMLGIWQTAVEIGLYSSVQRVQQFMIIIPTTIATAVAPIMAQLATTEKKQFGVLLGKITSLIMMIGIPITIGGIMLSEEIILLIFGSSYLGAVPIMQILMLMLLASFPLVILSSAIFSFNRQKNLALAYGLGVVANIIFNVLLIPFYGAIGAALATLASTTAITGIIWIKLHHIQPFHVFHHLGKSLIATIIMAAIIAASMQFHIHVIIVIILAIIVYGGTLIITKEPLIQETRNLFKF